MLQNIHENRRNPFVVVRVGASVKREKENQKKRNLARKKKLSE